MSLKTIEVEKLIDVSQRKNNPIDEFILEYNEKNKLKFIGRVFDIYSDNEATPPKTFLILYNEETKRYERRLFKNFKENIQFKNYKKPVHFKQQYLIEVYYNLTYCIDFMDEYDSNNYLVHLAHSNKYMRLKKSAVKSVKEV